MSRVIGVVVVGVVVGVVGVDSIQLLSSPEAVAVVWLPQKERQNKKQAAIAVMLVLGDFHL